MALSEPLYEYACRLPKDKLKETEASMIKIKKLSENHTKFHNGVRKLHKVGIHVWYYVYKAAIASILKIVTASVLKQGAIYTR